MSVNKLELEPEMRLFTDEKILYQNLNTSFSYDNSDGLRRVIQVQQKSDKGAGEQFYSAKGTVYMTAIRIIYIPATPTFLFKSFTIPLQNLEDGKLKEGWFGDSVYTAQVRSIQGEGLSKEWGIVKFGFKEKGADFQSYFGHLRSRMGVIPEQHVEPLPTYEEPGASVAAGSSSDIPIPAYQPSYNGAPEYQPSHSVPTEDSPAYDAPSPS